MDKMTTLNLRVNPSVKKKAEEILQQLGIPMSTAINMYLNQIVMTKGIPFPITLPKSVNADLLTDEELLSEIKKGCQDYLNGNVRDAKEAFE